ncbi:hypothetical protein [Hwanghaeella sp.]|uniref:hypothetical protein n=1 Tax=Hwanghaeella sp. TaxID=2605943 RepID=UPI003CCC000B
MVVKQDGTGLETMVTLFDTVQHAFAVAYGRACGGWLWPQGAETTSLARKPICVAVLFLMAVPLLAVAWVIELVIPGYLRFLVLVWIAGVFFFLASVDQRAARLLMAHPHPNS